MDNSSTATVVVGTLSYRLDPALSASKGEPYGTMSWNTNRRIAVEVFIQGYKHPFRIPLDWLERCGNATWAHVYYLLHLFVNEEGFLLAAAEDEGVEVTMEESAAAGQYLFRPRHGERFTWRIGPQGNRKQGVKALGGDDASSVATSMSVPQGRFAKAVNGRDYKCIITNVSESCQAAHLVPKTRTDVYAELLGDDFDPDYPYRVSHGVLLKSDLHKQYDEYAWSFYTKENDDSYYVHAFNEGFLGQFHGKIIPRTRFSPVAEIWELPDKRLCKWHYAQLFLLYTCEGVFGFPHATSSIAKCGFDASQFPSQRLSVACRCRIDQNRRTIAFRVRYNEKVDPDESFTMDNIKEGSPARILLANASQSQVDFSHNNAADKTMLGNVKVVRYQQNPTANWDRRPKQVAQV